MAKVFTITEGLENMGALKTGGQGSIYKARRTGTIITAVKILPTPIYSESADDKHFVDFKNEVEKLKKVNEKPNPNVVKILNSGITESGSFPFIEMEFIEGPDLEELLKPPHDPVFTIKEISKVAEQLSSALAHCHRVDVKHGDIKSNNVKYNIQTGNYILLDFGLAIMSDEQRRTSLRNAGAIEFMAPEQNEGIMLFQTDVYGFGVVLYELLAGRVPFPLLDKGETARNMVRLAHMETTPPDMLSLRRDLLPAHWPEGKKDHEMQVPEWIVSMIYKCLEKKPEARFANGIQLHEYIILNSTLSAKKEASSVQQVLVLQEEKQKLLQEKDQLQQSVVQYQTTSEKGAQELEKLKSIVIHKDSEVQFLKEKLATRPSSVNSAQGISPSLFYALLLITTLLGGFVAYSYFFNKKNEVIPPTNISRVPPDTFSHSDYHNTTQSANIKLPDKKVKKETANYQSYDTANIKSPVNNDNPATNAEATDTPAAKEGAVQKSDNEPEQNNSGFGQYKVVSKAYFYNQPDSTTRRNAFIVHWNNAILTPLDEKNDFVYIVFTNYLGQTSKGWLRKKDLIRIGD